MIFTDKSKIPNPKVSNDDTTLFSVLKEQLPTFNVARVKLISLFICALYKVQTVNYDKLAIGFEVSAKKILIYDIYSGFC
jgi:hypothetical protein